MTEAEIEFVQTPEVAEAIRNIPMPLMGPERVEYTHYPDYTAYVSVQPLSYRFGCSTCNVLPGQHCVQSKGRRMGQKAVDTHDARYRLYLTETRRQMRRAQGVEWIVRVQRESRNRRRLAAITSAAQNREASNNHLARVEREALDDGCTPEEIEAAVQRGVGRAWERGIFAKEGEADVASQTQHVRRLW